MSTNDQGVGNVDETTLEHERREAKMTADAGPMPTIDEEEAAERNRVGPSVAEHEREMLEIGKNVRGEGQLD